MRRYETIYILRPSLGEAEINTIVENTNSIITSDKGQIIELDRWGMRKLAYQIKKEVQGFYVFCDYSGNPDAVAEMERKFRIDDSVLRYMTVKIADSITEEEIVEATKNAAEKIAAAQEEQESSEEKTEVPEKKETSSEADPKKETAEPVAEKAAETVVAEEATSEDKSSE